MPLVNDLLPYGDTVAHVHNAIFANFPSLYIHFQIKSWVAGIWQSKHSIKALSRPKTYISLT